MLLLPVQVCFALKVVQNPPFYTTSQVNTLDTEPQTNVLESNKIMLKVQRHRDGTAGEHANRKMTFLPKLAPSR